MAALLWLLPALPLVGFVVLGLAPRKLAARAVAVIGVGTVGASLALALALGAAFLSEPPAVGAWVHTLGPWLALEHLDSAFALRLDMLSLSLSGVICFVGFLIHLYSAAYMAGDTDYRRYFAWLNFFLGAMLLLVLADDLLLLYFGWEAVGLASYALIGFWHAEPANGRAARKAFVVTRIGDVALLLGLILLATEFGTTRLDAVLAGLGARWTAGEPLALAAALLVAGGALGKSAQLPLHTWLPDAMAGPTPVSALIHAATMVTAGVYLIARLDALFALAPAARSALATLGAATLLLGALAAAAQHDIKRVLAYSTISQLGYMFLALGVAAPALAVFHLVTHAFFKALLFLAAGVVIAACDGEHDIRRMGGLRHALPLPWLCFAAGAAALGALPLASAGWYSKEAILFAAWQAPDAGRWLWAVALLGALVTALYAFRLLFRVFHGAARGTATAPKGERIAAPMAVPLVVLAALSLAGALIPVEALLAGAGLFAPTATEPAPTLPLALAGDFAALGGLALAWLIDLRAPALGERWARQRVIRAFGAMAGAGFGFDALYRHALVTPFVRLTRANAGDVIDRGADALAAAARIAHRALARSQNGRLRWYAAGVVLGSVLLLAAALVR